MKVLPRISRHPYKKMVLKIQKPIASTGASEALIYNEDRSVETMLPWTVELDDLFGDDLKQYWICKVPQFDRGYIKLIRQVEEPAW